MQNRKQHSRKQIFCEESARICGIHVHQFSAMFIWNNTSQPLSITRTLIPSSSGFSPKADAFSKHDYVFKMVNACTCPSRGLSVTGTGIKIPHSPLLFWCYFWISGSFPFMLYHCFVLWLNVGRNYQQVNEMNENLGSLCHGCYKAVKRGREEWRRGGGQREEGNTTLLPFVF